MEPSKFDRLMRMSTGFRDGAAGKAIPEQYSKCKDYSLGYMDGRKAKQEAVGRYTSQLGIHNSQIGLMALR